MRIGFKAIRLLATAALFARCRSATPSVKVGLRSSWPAPPLLVELLETVTLNNPDAFLPFLDAIINSETISPETLSPEAVYHAVLQTAVSDGFLSQPGSLAIAELNLALHSATPKIEAFYQYYQDVHGEKMAEVVINDDCGSWVDWYGETICDLDGLIRLVGRETLDPSETTHTYSRTLSRPKILPFDHIFPSPSRTLERPPHTAVFYASPTSSNFRDLHKYLFSLANRPVPHVEYVFRHIPPGNHNTSERNYLSGYGVSLDLKKMEYLALDDRYASNQESLEQASSKDQLDMPEVDPIIDLLKTYPENDTIIDPSLPLTQLEISEIGLQSTQLILDSHNPLDTLIYLSQNFPKYASAIARRVTVNDSLMWETSDNYVKAQPGFNMLWLNGVQVDEKDITPLSLLRLIRKEQDLMSSLTSLGITPSQAVDLLTDSAITAAQSENDILDGIFDASDRLEGGGVIIWWNDIEKDNRYSRWGASMYGLLQPMYPGQLPNVKRNLFNTVLVLDLSKTSSLNFIAGAVSGIIERNIPLRFGVVPTIKNTESLEMARLFYFLIHKFGRVTTMAFLKQISQFHISLSAQAPTVDWKLVRSIYDELVSTENPADSTPAPSLDSVVNGSEDSLFVDLKKVDDYAERLGVNSVDSKQGDAFVNGRHYQMDDNFMRHMQSEIGHQLQYFQQKVYEQALTDEMAENISTYFYDLPTAHPCRNRFIYPTTVNGGLRIVNLPELFSRTGFHVTLSGFVYPQQTEVPLSLFLIADLDSDSGINLIKEALSTPIDLSQTRVSFIHNPRRPNGQPDDRRRPSWIISHLMNANLLFKMSPSQLLQVIGMHLQPERDDGQQFVLSQDELLGLLANGVTINDFDPVAYEKYVQSTRLVARDLRLAPGEEALIINGRVIGPLQGANFMSADFSVLEAYEMRKRVEPVIKALERIVPPEHDRVMFGQLVSMASSVISSNQLPDPSEVGLFDTPQKPRHRSYQLLSDNYTAFELGNESTALYHVAILLDPISEAAQKWSSLVKWLSNIPEVYIKCYLNPLKYSELPLKRFYRYNLLPRLLFDEVGKEASAQTIFRNLPPEPIYTLAMDVPSSWLVRPREALYDLDNIQLGSIPSDEQSVEALFDLDYLIIEGHARETHTNAPPRGLQLQLVNSNSVPVGDTQVVANLGYLQFKSKPGVFQLEIRPGRGKNIFRMESVGNEGWDSPTVETTGSEITLTSFEGLTLYPRLSRLPGMETADVLAELHESNEPDERQGLFGYLMSSLTSLFRTRNVDEAHTISQSAGQADINIFTVASGLLYERFVSIMILSVLRNTHSTVKFWFIENFLSPSFLEFIPHLAEAYNFQYELVTYKWPSWLRAQKEKQRIIWAYKILFLDVLFPMDLKKVIFVDADQIVRADLKELVDLDLRGAPYGYTPMGDDNEEMEGFRFWKTGYWKDFLRGRPYHISALYVIDLVRFRQIAAGDILRGQYQALSQDPNSLANLDQDLPNNLQREVPIFSLHEDWLWCETWCSKDRLHRAKTIDLCQNPLTKEPKLSRARQIPEWEEYDAEIARFAQKLAENGTIRSRMAAADANVLAGGGNNAKVDPEQVEVAQSFPEMSNDQVHKPDDEL